jgi:hypothetical protein
LPKGVERMEINPIKQGQAAPSAIAVVMSRPLTLSGGSSKAPAAKKDTAIILEKAKDLAAQKAGKGAAEGSSESMSSKNLEADGD